MAYANDGLCTIGYKSFTLRYQLIYFTQTWAQLVGNMGLGVALAFQAYYLLYQALAVVPVWGAYMFGGGALQAEGLGNCRCGN